MNLDTNKYVQLTHDGKSSDSIYDDENTLLFSASRTKEDQEEPFTHKTVFYRLPLNGGEAHRAFEIPLNVMSIQKIDKNLYAIKALVDWNEPDSKKNQKNIVKNKKIIIFLKKFHFGEMEEVLSQVKEVLYISLMN